jgi:hypothetical protein
LGKFHRRIHHLGFFSLILVIVLFVLNKGHVLSYSFSSFKILAKESLDLIKSALLFLFWFFVGAFLHAINNAITGKALFVILTKKF